MGVAPVDKTTVWAAVGSRNISVGYAVDPLAAVMLVMVSIVATCIQIYSIGYMHGDRRFERFFAYLSLFCGSMFLIVLANNFIMLYAGWELVGLCSYLLIGFWFERRALRARHEGLHDHPHWGRRLRHRHPDPVLLRARTALRRGLRRHWRGPDPAPDAGAGRRLLFCGAIGKSAQFPLHTWLPDAMEGPTPVSALIHAATMVAAGVYMVAPAVHDLLHPGLEPKVASAGRCFLTPLTWVAVIGLITALMAATIGVVQSDIKRVLAYSTISQLGFMMVAMGMGVGDGRRDVPPAHPRLLQGPALPGLRQRHPLLLRGAEHVGDGRPGQEGADPPTGPSGPARWPWRASSRSPGSSPRTRSCSPRTTTRRSTALYWVFFIGLEIAAFLTAFYMGRAVFPDLLRRAPQPQGRRTPTRARS
jgi:hypothetical protein